jgi:hypothetical protein
MPLHVYFTSSPGQVLQYAILRRADGLLWDFQNAVFSATPASAWAGLPELTTLVNGLYSATLSATPVAQFGNDQYIVPVKNTVTGAAVGVAVAEMYGGDDAPVFPAAVASAVWTYLIEAGLQAAQALSVAGSASGGVLTGAGTTTVTLAALGNPSVNRITAQTDASGNRTSIQLHLNTYS